MTLKYVTIVPGMNLPSKSSQSNVLQPQPQLAEHTFIMLEMLVAASAPSAVLPLTRNYHNTDGGGRAASFLYTAGT